MPTKRYLGDAVYAEYDGYSVVLTTENGISTTNTIYLEPELLSNLFEYWGDIKKARAEHLEASK